MDRLPDIAAATAAAHAMFAEGGPVVAMVSGGADSVALLRWLADWKAAGTLLSVLHVNHQLRGDAADSDAAFVERLCGDLGVSCRIVAYDVGAYATEAGLNLEDAGRRVRYRFADEELDARCADAGAEPEVGRVATAHTFDDRAETMVMRLAQGTGASGLVSPPYRRGRVVRPLLDCTRADVTRYLADLGQPWREDATNLDTSRLRARVRADVVPLLREINPRFDATLARATSDVRRGRSARRRGGGRGGRARRSPWRRAEDRPCSIGASASASLELALEGTTLADLAARQRELDARAAAMYYI
jgi:tRNA(Ile)-lysidine synthase